MCARMVMCFRNFNFLFQKSEQITGNDSGTSKPGLQDLSADLNARMTLIAMEQAQTKEDSAVGNAEQSSQSKLQYFSVRLEYATK